MFPPVVTLSAVCLMEIFLPAVFQPVVSPMVVSRPAVLLPAVFLLEMPFCPLSFFTCYATNYRLRRLRASRLTRSGKRRILFVCRAHFSAIRGLNLNIHRICRLLRNGIYRRLRFRPFAESFANRFAPYFRRPIHAASAPGLRAPRRLSLDLSAENRLPVPSLALRAICTPPTAQ